MRHTVLLVDDEPNVLAGLTRALRQEPFETLAAASAAEAWKVLHRRPVHCVVSDQDMPGQKGTEFLAQVAQEFPETIRFILTGKGTLDVAIEAINTGGVTRYFTKPCQPLDLAWSIRQALENRSLVSQVRRLLAVVKSQGLMVGQLEQRLLSLAEVKADVGGLVLQEEMKETYEELMEAIEIEFTPLRE